MYLAFNPDKDGREPVGGSNKALRNDLTTDKGAIRWARNLIFYRAGETRLMYFSQDLWYTAGRGREIRIN